MTKYRETSVRRASEAILRRVDFRTKAFDFPIPRRLERSLERAVWARYKDKRYYLKQEPTALWMAAWSLCMHGFAEHYDGIPRFVKGHPEPGRLMASRPFLEGLRKAARRRP